MANEADRDTRQRLEEARIRLLDEHINPIQLEAAEIDRQAAAQLGAPNLYELYKRFGYRLDELADECRALLDETERLWEREGDRLMRARLGLGLDEVRPWDMARLFRAPQLDQLYPPDRMLPALESTLSDLGIDLRAQANVHLDIEQRPNKSPRAFCAPVEVPGKVMLVIQPTGGKDDWEALFHEAGHAEHYAHVDADLPVEARRMGDSGITEGWAARSPPSSSRAGTRRSCSTRSSSSRRTTSRRCGRATPSCSATRSSCRCTRRATSTTSTAATT
jgi:oligoendopeptidase F